MSLPHAWPVDQVVTELTRGRAAVLEDGHRRPRHTWHSERSRGHAQSSLRAESSPSRALLACGHSKMAIAAEVLQRDLGTGKSFGNSVFNGARPPTRSVHHSAETDSAPAPSDANRAKPHAQSSPRYESSPSRAPSARGHSKMSEVAEVLQRDLGTGKSFCNSAFNVGHGPRCAPCPILQRLTRRRRRRTGTVQNRRY